MDVNGKDAFPNDVLCLCLPAEANRARLTSQTWLNPFE